MVRLLIMLFFTVDGGDDDDRDDRNFLSPAPQLCSSRLRVVGRQGLQSLGMPPLQEDGALQR